MGSGRWTEGTAGFCARLVEACWLVAVGVVPLLYDPHAALGFDPIKLVAIRALGAVAGIAVIVGMVSVRRWPERVPLWVGAAGWVAASAMVASVFSIDPGRSFWGSPQFLQGTWSLVCGLALFVGVALVLRTAEQLNRLVVVALTASVPVAAYALIQKAGLDPLGFADTDGAAFSFGGHPIYLAGYLAMLMPLAVWKVWQCRAEDRMRLVWALVLLAQFSAFLATEKRGPFVALVVGGVVVTCLVAVKLRRWRLVAWGAGMGVAMTVVLLALAVMLRAGFPLESVPVVSRLARIVPIGEGTGDPFRKALWGEAPAMVLGRAALVYPDGTTDGRQAVRAWIGSGPETLQAALAQRWLYLAGGPLLRYESRFHNSFWDTWQSVGLVGLTGAFVFFAALFDSGRRAMGLVRGVRGPWMMLAWGGAGGILGGGALGAASGYGDMGMGVPIGLLAGLVCWVLWAGFRDPAESDRIQLTARDGLVAALLAAVAIHWVDLIFAFQTGETLSIHWVLAGALVACGRRQAGEEPLEHKSESWVTVGCRAGALSGLMLVVVAHAFVNGRFMEPVSWWSVLASSFGGDRLGGLALLVIVWLTANILLVRGGGATVDWRRSALLGGGISLGIGGVVAVVKAFWVTRTGRVPAADAPVESVVSLAWELGWVSPMVVAVCLVGVLALAVIGTRVRPLVVVAAGLAMMFIWILGIGPLREGAASASGDFLYRAGRWKQAAAVFDLALTIDPGNVPNRMQRANALMDSAEASDAGSGVVMKSAVATLKDGVRFAPLSSIHRHLGLAYLRWSLVESDPALRRDLAARAVEAYERAVRFEPGSEIVWFDASLADQSIDGNSSAAREKLERANALTARVTPPEPNIVPAIWGDFYYGLANRSHSSELQSAYARRAMRYFSRALSESDEIRAEGKLSEREAARLREDDYRTRLTRGLILRRMGDKEGALEEFNRATAIKTEADAWEAEGRLAETLAEMGEIQPALQHVARAIAGAPDDSRADLVKLEQYLRQASVPEDQR